MRYDAFHSKAEHLGPERYLVQWNGRHLRKAIVNGLIRFVVDGIELVYRAGAHIEGLDPSDEGLTQLRQRSAELATSELSQYLGIAFAAKQRGEHRSTAQARDVHRHAGQLQIGDFECLL